MFNSSFWIWTNFFHQVNALTCFNLYLFTECSAHNNWPMLLNWWCPSPHNCQPLFWFCSSSCGGRSNFGPISVCFLFAPGKWLRWQWWQDFGPIFYPVVGRVQKWPLWALPQIERQQTNKRRWKNSRNPQNLSPWCRFEVKYRQKFIQFKIVNNQNIGVQKSSYRNWNSNQGCIWPNSILCYPLFCIWVMTFWMK